MGDGYDNNIYMTFELKLDDYDRTLEFKENYNIKQSNLVYLLDFISVFWLYKNYQNKDKRKTHFSENLSRISNNLFDIRCFYIDFKNGIYDLLNQKENKDMKEISDDIEDKVIRLFRLFRRKSRKIFIEEDIDDILIKIFDGKSSKEFNITKDIFKEILSKDFIENSKIEYAFENIIKYLGRIEYYNNLLPYFKKNKSYPFKLKYDENFIKLILSNFSANDNNHSLVLEQLQKSYFLKKVKDFLLNAKINNPDYLKQLHDFINDNEIFKQKKNKKYIDRDDSNGCYAMILDKENLEMYYAFSGYDDENIEDSLKTSLEIFFRSIFPSINRFNFCKLDRQVKRLVNLGATEYKYSVEESKYGIDIIDEMKGNISEDEAKKQIHNKKNPYGCCERKMLRYINDSDLELELYSRWCPCFKCIPVLEEFNDIHIHFINKGPTDRSECYYEKSFILKPVIVKCQLFEE